MNNQNKWDLIIRPSRGVFDFRFGELWYYRDLLFLLVRRDIVTVYKQTLFGFFWFLIPPILNAFIYLVVFGLFSKVNTGSSNIVLFYLSGMILWGFFSDCINRISGTFRANASVFGKVYFPRLIVPISSVISAFVKFSIQFLFFIVIVILYEFLGNGVDIQWHCFWVIPLVLVNIGLMGLSLGVIISALTIKYRDLISMIPFLVQILMYSTPVVYPYTFFPDNIKIVFDINPLTSLFESFRYFFINSDRLVLTNLVYSFFFTIFALFIGLVLFNRTEQNSMDIV